MSTEQLILQGIPFLLSPVSVAIVAYFYQRFLSLLPHKQREIVEREVKRAVFAVEQTSVALSGEGKRQEALRIIDILLKEAGVSASPTFIQSALEEAVLGVNALTNSPQPTTILPKL